MLVHCLIFFHRILSSYAIRDEFLPLKPEINVRRNQFIRETTSETYNKHIMPEISYLVNIKSQTGEAQSLNNNNTIHNDFENTDMNKITHFIENILEILNKYSDKDLKYFLNVLNEEIRKYHYRGCKFYELTENDEFRKFIATNLNIIKKKPITTIRRYLTTIFHVVKEDKIDENERELLQYVNSLYGQDSIVKLQTFLTNVDDYRHTTKKNMDLVRIIREGIRAVLFDHYTGLNYNVRKALKAKLDEYWQATYKAHENDIKESNRISKKKLSEAHSRTLLKDGKIKKQVMPGKKIDLMLKMPELIIQKPIKRFPKSNRGFSKTTLQQRNILYKITMKAEVLPSYSRTIKTLIGSNNSPSHRNNFRNISGNSVVVDKNVLIRMKELEKELNVAKTQIKNDSEIIKMLSNKVLEKKLTDVNNVKFYYPVLTVPRTKKHYITPHKQNNHFTKSRLAKNITKGIKLKDRIHIMANKNNQLASPHHTDWYKPRKTNKTNKIASKINSFLRRQIRLRIKQSVKNKTNQKFTSDIHKKVPDVIQVKRKQDKHDLSHDLKKNDRKRVNKMIIDHKNISNKKDKHGIFNSYTYFLKKGSEHDQEISNKETLNSGDLMDIMHKKVNEKIWNTEILAPNNKNSKDKEEKTVFEDPRSEIRNMIEFSSQPPTFTFYEKYFYEYEKHKNFEENSHDKPKRDQKQNIINHNVNKTERKKVFKGQYITIKLATASKMNSRQRKVNNNIHNISTAKGTFKKEIRKNENRKDTNKNKVKLDVKFLKEKLKKNQDSEEKRLKVYSKMLNDFRRQIKHELELYKLVPQNNSNSNKQEERKYERYSHKPKLNTNRYHDYDTQTIKDMVRHNNYLNSPSRKIDNIDEKYKNRTLNITLLNIEELKRKLVSNESITNNKKQHSKEAINSEHRTDKYNNKETDYNENNFRKQINNIFNLESRSYNTTKRNITYNRQKSRHLRTSTLSKDEKPKHDLNLYSAEKVLSKNHNQNLSETKTNGSKFKNNKDKIRKRRIKHYLDSNMLRRYFNRHDSKADKENQTNTNFLTYLYNSNKQSIDNFYQEQATESINTSEKNSNNTNATEIEMTAVITAETEENGPYNDSLKNNITLTNENNNSTHNITTIPTNTATTSTTIRTLMTLPYNDEEYENLPVEAFEKLLTTPVRLILPPNYKNMYRLTPSSLGEIQEFHASAEADLGIDDSDLEFMSTTPKIPLEPLAAGLLAIKMAQKKGLEVTPDPTIHKIIKERLATYDPNAQYSSSDEFVGTSPRYAPLPTASFL